MSNKLLDKVSKLLNQAENAGTPEEAATFMAKVQELASINNIDLAVARMHQANKEKAQEPVERKISVNPTNRRHNRKHFMDLAMAIADVNGVEYLISGKEYNLYAIGFPSDLDVLEALYTHLAVQMATECDEALARGENREVRKVLVTERRDLAWEDREWGQWNGKQFYDEDPCEDIYCYQRSEETNADYLKRKEVLEEEARVQYEKDIAEGNAIYSAQSRRYEGGYRKPVPPPKFFEVAVLDAEGNKQYEEKEVSAVDGRVFRGNFYDAFVRRMKGRLWEIKRSVERERGVEEVTGETAVALRDKKAEVDKAHQEQRAKVHHLGTYRGASESVRAYDHTGIANESGREAAVRVPIDQGREVKK